MLTNGPHETIVFGSHSELGECADLSTVQLHAPSYEQDHFVQLELSAFHSSFTVVLFLFQLSFIYCSVEVGFQLCETVPDLSSQKQVSGRLPSDRVRCATIQNKKVSQSMFQTEGIRFAIQHLLGQNRLGGRYSTFSSSIRCRMVRWNPGKPDLILLQELRELFRC